MLTATTNTAVPQTRKCRGRFSCSGAETAFSDVGVSKTVSCLLLRAAFARVPHEVSHAAHRLRDG